MLLRRRSLTEGEIKAKGGVVRPEEYCCPFRGRLRRSFGQPECKDRGIWYVDEAGRYLEEVLHDARMVIMRDLPPWFDRIGTHSDALQILQSDNERMDEGLWGFGSANSPHRNYLIGYFALSVGRNELVRPYLDAALASGCYDRLALKSRPTSARRANPAFG